LKEAPGIGARADEVEAFVNSKPSREFSVGLRVVAANDRKSRRLAHSTHRYHRTVETFAFEAVTAEENKGFLLGQLYRSASGQAVCRRVKLL
jgi:hypothetical protein